MHFNDAREHDLSLEQREKWLKCYQEFEKSCNDLFSKFPPPPQFSPEEAKATLFGIPTPKSLKIAQDHNVLIGEWDSSMNNKLKKIVDDFIGKYGKTFCFRVIGKHYPHYSRRSDIEVIDGFTVCWTCFAFRHKPRRPEEQRKWHEDDVKSIKSKARRRERESTKVEREARRLKKQRQDKALVAAAAGKSRNLSSSIKRKLRVNHPCPYCGGPLGADYHADHIYPVSKGGLSTIQNMVNVCSSCNLAKKDQTLGIFIRKYGLCRDEVESRLETLGKEF